MAALVGRSSKPQGCVHQMPVVVEARIVELRRAHPGWEPRTLLDCLARERVEPLPGRSSVHRALLRHRLIEPGKRRRKREDYKRWDRQLREDSVDTVRDAAVWQDRHASTFTLEFRPLHHEGLVFHLHPNVFGEYPYDVGLEELPLLEPAFAQVERTLQVIWSLEEDEDVPPHVRDLAVQAIRSVADEVRSLEPGWRFVPSAER